MQSIAPARCVQWFAGGVLWNRDAGVSTDI